MKIENRALFQSVEDSIKRGERVKILLVGYSMYPFLRNGRDKVILSPFKSEDLNVGIIALFRYNGGYIMHRIVAIKDGVYLFRGDGNVHLIERATIDDIIAVMVGFETPSGRVQSCSTRSWRVKSWLWMKLYPIRRYLLFIFRRLQIVEWNYKVE